MTAYAKPLINDVKLLLTVLLLPITGTIAGVAAALVFGHVQEGLLTWSVRMNFLLGW